MNAYETRKYLERVKVLDALIREKEEEYEVAEAYASANGGIRYDKDRVISSPPTDPMADRVIRYVDLLNEIKKERLHFLILKNRVINQIARIEDARYVEILNLRYVGTVTKSGEAYYWEISEIARRLHYSYDWTRHLTAQAINEFGKILENETEVSKW